MKMINFIDRVIFNKKIYMVKIDTMNNLKYWRNSDYKKSVTSQKKLGGGLVLELSHELDLVLNLFSYPKIIHKLR